MQAVQSASMTQRLVSLAGSGRDRCQFNQPLQESLRWLFCHQPDALLMLMGRKELSRTVAT
jgi:hypothetical protein